MDVRGRLHAPAALPLTKEHIVIGLGGWVGPRAGLDTVDYYYYYYYYYY
jgi:hypothetical protein